MNAIEIEAKNIDEAIGKACQEFNVPREKLNIEIISEGSTGFLGLGSRKAKIKASMLSLGMDLDDTVELSKKEEIKPESLTLPIKKALPATQPAQVSPGEPKESAPLPPLAMRAKTILEGILTRMHLDFPITVEETSDTILLTINGDGGGLLIGKRGQNLDAIQYIVNKAATKTPDERKVIIIDTESMIKTTGFKKGDGMRGFKKKVQNAFRFGPADPDDPYTANTGGGGNGGYRIFKHYIIAGLKDMAPFYDRDSLAKILAGRITILRYSPSPLLLVTIVSSCWSARWMSRRSCAFM